MRIHLNKCWNICRDGFGSCKGLVHLQVPGQRFTHERRQEAGCSLDKPPVEIKDPQEPLYTFLV